MSTATSTLNGEQCRDKEHSAALINSDQDFMDGLVRVLFRNRELADICFVLRGVRFYAHRVILAFRCEYFKYADCSESTEPETKLSGTMYSPFLVVLKYIYGVRFDLSLYGAKELVAILRLAHEYGLTKLQQAAAEILEVISRFYEKPGLTNGRR
ncbi:unnamed protein product [Heligmosomoides polygyrus]|uniref:BTB domain-containing protein n=1 Tax=Heligmosomoides polygyrus TaxID=6339 RepID=A0A183FUK3_HELPZ|nr:unnamed protein product [Heligmosomoides polygyrus]